MLQQRSSDVDADPSRLRQQVLPQSPSSPFLRQPVKQGLAPQHTAGPTAVPSCLGLHSVVHHGRQLRHGACGGLRSLTAVPAHTHRTRSAPARVSCCQQQAGSLASMHCRHHVGVRAQPAYSKQLAGLLRAFELRGCSLSCWLSKGKSNRSRPCLLPIFAVTRVVQGELLVAGLCCRLVHARLLRSCLGLGRLCVCLAHQLRIPAHRCGVSDTAGLSLHLPGVSRTVSSAEQPQQAVHP